MGFASASFELADPPLQDFLSGIGFAYALSLLARVCRFVSWLVQLVEWLMKVIRFEKIKVVIHDPVDIKQPSKQTMFMPSFQLMRPRVAYTGWRRYARHGYGSIGVLP